MANVQKEDFPLDPATANNAFSVLWQLSRCMKAAGWSVAASSDGTTNNVGAPDRWGTATDPMTDVYPTAFDYAAPWIVMVGPSTLKLACTSASTGTFLRGESVTQTTTAATGELLGFVFDATNGGWAVVLPRTGTFSATDLLTGDISGATVTPTALTTFSREVVFWKNPASVAMGSVYYICAADTVGETAQRFSVLASDSLCTGPIAPGGSTGISNNFPALGIVMRGTAAVPGGVAAVHDYLYYSSNYFGNANAVAVNATAGAGTSADGTFWSTISASLNPGSMYGWGFFRLDDGESGDVDPFVFFYPSQEYGGWYRLSSLGPLGSYYLTWASFGNGPNYPAIYKGYCARGLGNAKDAAIAFDGAARVLGTSSNVAMVMNTADVYRLCNHPAAQPPVPRESLVVVSYRSSFKMFKGSPRWIGLFPFGAGFDTFDSLRWMIVLSQGSNIPAVGFGPIDGSTVPGP